jgi:hypothetical protein
VATKVLVALNVVNAPVLAVVAPTVPLILMDAVPLALVSTMAEGVPRAGVTSVGLVANTRDPLPVSSVTAAAKLAEDGVARNVAMPVPRPDTPVLMGRPVQLVNVPLEGVPRTGVVSVGLVRVLFVRVSEPAKVASVPVVGSVSAVLAVAVKD